MSINALSVYILKHKQNDICEKNLLSIQDAMCSDDPAGSELERVSTDLPNLEVLTKSEYNTRQGNIPVIWGVYLILTRYRHY